MTDPTTQVQAVLSEIEEDIENYIEVNDPRVDDEELLRMRRLETTFRMLAREAGYELER